MKIGGIKAGDTMDFTINTKIGELNMYINSNRKKLNFQHEDLKLDNDELYPSVLLIGDGGSVCFLNPTKQEIKVSNL